MKKILLLVISILISNSLIHSQTVVTYAGIPNEAGNSQLMGPRLTTKLYRPGNIAVDSKGNMWISESGNHVITVLMASNENLKYRVGAHEQASFKDATGITSRFNTPMGIAVSPDDDIYVADYNNHVIRKITKFENLGVNQIVTVFAGSYGVSGDYYTPKSGYADGGLNTARFNGPTDLAFDASGNLYVVDQGNHCIRKVDASGNVTTFAGQPGLAGNTNGDALSTAKFNTPTGIFIEGNDIYIADRLNSSIRKISGGQVTTVVDGLWTPSDLVKVGSKYYISDQHRVQLYDGSSLSVYVGSPNLNDPGSKNGKGTDARFKNISGLMFYNNELYIADQDNHVIRAVVNCQGYKPTITKNELKLTASEGMYYQWFNAGAVISGATNRNYNVTQTGDYSVSVTSLKGCVATSDEMHVDYSSSIFENSSIT
jgi:hypothetical protein